MSLPASRSLKYLFSRKATEKDNRCRLFYTHKTLLCNASPRLKKAIEETPKKVDHIDLINTHHQFYADFQKRLYTHRLFEADQENVVRLPTDVRYLIGLYSFARDLGITALQNSVIDAFIRKVAIESQRFSQR